ncbi:hypothetical protein SAY87_026687 [Trapa incisa]|uniref:Nuclear transcription factor Y subunit n=1 Tax=Trapa incisa TaxID=236973 RepID=A0AAN7GY93_9MYRT|nr:hypothetical protein SAY87_026687 [Trapa incisa]
MTTQALYLKEHEGILQNPMDSTSTPSALWWAAGYGSQPFQPKPSAGERTGQGMDHCVNKGSAIQFTISCADSKYSGDPLKSQAGLPCTHFELGFTQPMVCAKYQYADPCYGIISTHGPQMQGRVMLPLDLAANDVPIFVNPKQYHSIMKSRERRAKAELKKKTTRVRKPYMHESRHLHAMRRPRGSGGRFLNTKNLSSRKGEVDPRINPKGHQLSQPTGSKSLDVLQSDSGTMNSLGEANGSVTSLLGSTEVTSHTYAQEVVGRSPMNRLYPPLNFLPVSGGVDTGHNVLMPSTWVVAADNCYSLKF